MAGGDNLATVALRELAEKIVSLTLPDDFKMGVRLVQ